MFDIPDLSLLDLSHNNLQAFPKDIENAKGLIVLNLSYNQYVEKKRGNLFVIESLLFRIEQIPSHVFVSLFELVHLNMSNNKIGKTNF